MTHWTLGPAEIPGGDEGGDRWYSAEAYAAAAVTNGSGTVYWVDAARPDNSGNGLSEATAKKTIGAVIGPSGILNHYDGTDRHGVTIRIKAGIYRETIDTDGQSGNASERLVIGAHGDGPVIIDGSEAPTWSLHSGSIYKATLSQYGSGKGIQAVVVDEVPLFPCGAGAGYTLAALEGGPAGRWFFNTSTHVLYLWCPGGQDPSTRTVGILLAGDDTSRGFFVDNASYVTLYGMTFRHWGGCAIHSSYIRVENCRILFTNGSALVIWGDQWNDGKYNDLIKCEVYHAMMFNWPRQYAYGGWGQGVTLGRDSTCQGNIVHKCGGEGIGVYSKPLTENRVVISDNIVYDNFSVGIYIDNSKKVTAEKNFVYSNTPDVADMTNCGFTVESPGDDGEYYRIAKRMRMIGMCTADEGNPAQMEDVIFRNNLIVNCSRGVSHIGEATGTHLHNVQVQHNTIVVPSDCQSFETEEHTGRSNFVGIYVWYMAGYPAITSSFRNNLIYASHVDTWTMWSEGPSGAEQFEGLTIDHNVLYHANKSAHMHWGATWESAYDRTHAAWLALAGTAHGDGDVTSDPQLVDPTDVDSAADQRTQAGSPARNAGANLSVTEDWAGQSRDGTPTIGAWED